MLTEKQIVVFSLKREGLSNRQIAERLSTSESNISQILKRVREKIQSVEDTVALLVQLGEIKESPRYMLSDRGRIPPRIPHWIRQTEPFKPLEEKKFKVFTETFSRIIRFPELNMWRIWGEKTSKEYITSLDINRKFIKEAEEDVSIKNT